MAEWIEIIYKHSPGISYRSPLAMAEWIEIRLLPVGGEVGDVSASDGGVD